jgi:hypothetical protein
LPWKRLTLLDPVGAATRVKAVRAGAVPAACRAILKPGSVNYREVPAKTSGFCAMNDSLQALRPCGGMGPP